MLLLIFVQPHFDKRYETPCIVDVRMSVPPNPLSVNMLVFCCCIFLSVLTIFNEFFFTLKSIFH